MLVEQSLGNNSAPRDRTRPSVVANYLQGVNLRAVERVEWVRAALSEIARASEQDPDKRALLLGERWGVGCRPRDRFMDRDRLRIRKMSQLARYGWTLGESDRGFDDRGADGGRPGRRIRREQGQGRLGFGVEQHHHLFSCRSALRQRICVGHGDRLAIWGIGRL